MHSCRPLCGAQRSVRAAAAAKQNLPQQLWRLPQLSGPRELLQRRLQRRARGSLAAPRTARTAWPQRRSPAPARRAATDVAASFLLGPPCGGEELACALAAAGSSRARSSTRGEATRARRSPRRRRTPARSCLRLPAGAGLRPHLPSPPFPTRPDRPHPDLRNTL